MPYINLKSRTHM